MYKLVLALALGVATAFTPAPVARSATRLAGAKDDLVDLAESNTDALGAAIGFWDPLGASNLDFWGLGEEGTIGYLRHAEIKHGESSTPVAPPLLSSPASFPSVIPRILWGLNATCTSGLTVLLLVSPSAQAASPWLVSSASALSARTS